MNNTAVSSTKPAASEPDGKPSGKEKPGDATQNTNPDQQETAAKEAKQKGEKRKADPGKETSATREERYNNCISSKSTVVIMFNKCFIKSFLSLQDGSISTKIKTQTSMCQVGIAKKKMSSLS